MKKPLILLFLLSAVICASAQRQHRVTTKARKPVAAAAGIKLYNQMLESTAKVMFIDSVVVDKADFLSKVPLNPESGSLWLTNPKSDFKNHLAGFQNEFADRRIFARGDSATTALYTQTLLGDKWDRPSEITDFDASGLSLQNYPFLASDGVTLYFSAVGEGSVGGRDIFMSSFDSDNAQWYKPQNYGLPFNSTANDYLLAIDDLDTLGWLVTDRRQPEGKVCIYTFEPTETRQNFEDDNLSDAQLSSYARILSISDTWRFGNRHAALNRRDAMLARLRSKQSASAMRFVVDDKTVITSPSQFRNPQSRNLYKQVVELQGMIADTEGQLQTLRTAYHNGNRNISPNILKAETSLDQQRRDIIFLEKRIRALEKGR